MSAIVWGQTGNGIWYDNSASPTYLKSAATGAAWTGARAHQTVTTVASLALALSMTVGSAATGTRGFGYTASSGVAFSTTGNFRYVIELNTAGTVFVWNAGVRSASVSTWTTGDVFTVDINNTTVTYKKNGVTFSTSGTASSTYPLYIWNLLNTVGAINDADMTISGTGTFVDQVGTISTGTDVDDFIWGQSIPSRLPDYPNQRSNPTRNFQLWPR